MQYFKDIENGLWNEIAKRELKHRPDILEITFPRFSIRDYIAVAACQEHADKIRSAFETMWSDSIWAEKKMCWKPLMMDITYSEFRLRFPEKPISRFLKYYQALPEDVMHAMVSRSKAGTAIKACAASLGAVASFLFYNKKKNTFLIQSFIVEAAVFAIGRVLFTLYNMLLYADHLYTAWNSLGALLTILIYVLFIYQMVVLGIRRKRAAEVAESTDP